MVWHVVFHVERLVVQGDTGGDMTAPGGNLEGRKRSAYDPSVNLVPVKPGEVRNPTGKNQYTYRRDFERTIDELLAGDLTPEHAELIPEKLREMISSMPAMTRGKAIALITMAGALGGDEKQLPEVLKRLWPVVEKREVSGSDGGPLELTAGTTRIDMSVYTEEEREQLQSLIHKQLQKGGE